MYMLRFGSHSHPHILNTSVTEKQFGNQPTLRSYSDRVTTPEIIKYFLEQMRKKIRIMKISRAHNRGFIGRQTTV